MALVGSEAHIYCDLETIQPTINDDWGKYDKFKNESLLTPGTELTMDKDLLGGEIAHEFFSARQKFFDYTLALETKIRSLPKLNQSYFPLVFCGDGIQWRCDHLEDFADFYFLGQHRPDDPLGLMQSYYMTKKVLSSIAAFMDSVTLNARSSAFSQASLGAMFVVQPCRRTTLRRRIEMLVDGVFLSKVFADY